MIASYSMHVFDRLVLMLNTSHVFSHSCTYELKVVIISLFISFKKIHKLRFNDKKEMRKFSQTLNLRDR